MLEYFIADKLVTAARKPPAIVIIDTDMGADDMQALFVLKVLLDRSPSTRLLGITCCWGNTTIDNAVKNALIARKLAGLDCPIFKGCEKSTTGLNYNDDYFGEDGINGQQAQYYSQLSEKDKRVEDLHASQFIVNSVLANPGEVTLICIGPLTNLATALALSPSLSTGLRELVIMGGTLLGMGNVPAYPNSEFNFFCDGPATEAVLKAIKEPYILPYETCAYVDSMAKKGGEGLFGPPGGFIEKCFKHGGSVVDPLAMLFAMDCSRDYRVARLMGKVSFDGANAALMLHWLTDLSKANDPQLNMITAFDPAAVRDVCEKAHP